MRAIIYFNKKGNSFNLLLIFYFGFMAPVMEIKMMLIESNIRKFIQISILLYILNKDF